MRVLYGVCSWGLGHATRSLPIIRKLIDEGNEVTVVSTGSSLGLLKLELGKSAQFFDLGDYPLPYTENSKGFILKFSLIAPRLIRSIITEHKEIVNYVEKNKFDIIISDNRYGVFHKNVPSFLITHQLRMIAPARLTLIESGSETFNSYFQKHFTRILVPDFQDNGISGDLSHNLNKIDTKNVIYFGIISDFKKTEVAEDVDFLFSISGPEPQRQVLEDLILDQINDISGNIILSLGRKLKGEADKSQKKLNSNVEVYDFLPKEKREHIMNRSKFMISRSGYSTLMDIYALQKKALFIPTPQQTEQEYLAAYHKERGNFSYVNQHEMKLARDIELAKKFRGPDRKFDLKGTIDRFFEAVNI
jgi:uncharacterized protein (TIGR00661 family)